MPAFVGTRRALLDDGRSFLPTDIAGLQLWLRADAGTYQDAAKTTAAVSDGDVVGAWADQSGNGNDVTQAATGSKPTLKLNIKNGRPITRYDGGDYLFRADALTMSGSDKPMTALVVADVTSLVAGHTILAFGNSASDTQFFRVVFNTAPNYLIQRVDDAASAVNFFAGVPVINTWYIITVIFTGTAVTLRINGAVTGSANSAMNVGTLTLNRCAIGALLRTGAGAQHLGDIGEVAIYDSALAQADYERIEQYLSTRWGITLS